MIEAFSGERIIRFKLDYDDPQHKIRPTTEVQYAGEHASALDPVRGATVSPWRS
jgi:hypothetical protein